MLASDVTSADDVPGFDNSAMDGFALRAADTAGAHRERPCRCGSSASRGPAQPYDASRRGRRGGHDLDRSDGAAGADAVLRMEDADEADGELRGRRPAYRPARRSPRRRGHPRRRHRAARRARGSVLPSSGVAASTGVAELCLRARPRVAIVVTGDELVEPPAALAGADPQHQRLRRAGPGSRPGRPSTHVETVGDDYGATVAELRRALAADVVVVTGGVSVGPTTTSSRRSRSSASSRSSGGSRCARAPDLVRDPRCARSSSACRATRSRRWSPSTCSCGRRWPACSAPTPGERRAVAIVRRRLPQAPRPRARRALHARGARRRMARATDEGRRGRTC